MMIKRNWMGWVLVSAAALTAAALSLGRELSIDSCMDRGGSWDYDHESCIVASP
jgi:hypothetical protein